MRRDAPLDLRQRGAQAVPHEATQPVEVLGLVRRSRVRAEAARVCRSQGTPRIILKADERQADQQRFSVGVEGHGLRRVRLHIYRRQGHAQAFRRRARTIELVGRVEAVALKQRGRRAGNGAQLEGAPIVTNGALIRRP